MLLLVISCIVVVCLLLIIHDRNRRLRHEKLLLKAFSERASQRGMIFTSLEIVEKCVLGLDGTQRQLLIWDSSVNALEEVLIDLSTVRRCMARHHFNRCYEKLLVDMEASDSCSLVFEFFDGTIKEIRFGIVEDDISQLRDISIKASKWALLLSQLLPAMPADDSTGRLLNAS